MAHRLHRNQLEVLFELARSSQEMTGVDLANAIEGLGRSSAYAALAALQRAGMVSARWDTSGPRPLRMFKITAEGEEALERERKGAPALRHIFAGGG